MKRVYFGLLSLLATGCLIALPPTAFALEGNYTTEEQRTKTEEQQRSRVQIEAQKKQAQQEQTEAKQRLCHARERTIKAIMEHAAARGERQIKLFTTISERVQTFYTQKGKPLTTYEQLVSEVTAKKVAATVAVEATKAAGSSFSCSADNPKSVVENFKAKLHAQTEALQAYRQAVKNLIVGVKSVQGAASREASGEKAQ